MMKRIRTGLFATAFVLAGAWAGGLVPVAADAVPPESNPTLAPTERHEQIATLVTDFIERSHYRRTAVDDEVSGRVLDAYIEALDGNRSYFLQSDIDAFEQYRTELDDAVSRDESLDPAFEIFRVYRERAERQITHALALLDEEPDFSVEETFRFDREDAPWAASQAELDELWRKRVKNDALSLVLTEKPWEEVRDILEKRYKRFQTRFEQINSDDVFETFMNSYARTMDPHSSYLSPRNSEEYQIQMSLSYFGIGASLQMEDEYVTVMNIIPGGPAAIDGQLEPTDRITAVGQGDEGELVDVIGWRLDDVVQMIRGPAGTTVRLQILPGNALPGAEEEMLSLVRDQVKLEEQAAKSDIVTIPRDGRDWRVGVITVPSFYRDYEAQRDGDKDFTSTTRDVERLIGELEQEGVDGLIVDLRNNGGGHLTEATALSGLFIDRGPVVQLRDSTGRISVIDDQWKNGVAYDGPLAVLVNRFSASASEIFAAAIQDYERGVVIGQRTFGKGSVQNLYALDRFQRDRSGDGLGQLTLTIGKYYRVTGDSTQHRGVDPDIALPSVIDSEEVGESTRPTALPWDRIRATRYEAREPLDSTIDLLSTNFRERLKSDPDYDYLLKDIEAAQSMRERKTVSLALDERKQERERLQADRLARENERRKALDLAPVDSVEALDEEEGPDILLKEAASIVADMAQFLALPRPPAAERAAKNDL
ncbi:carboxy terminal-processing peptidase [Lentisalinibacter sediminis]|uniref:carboxy terminal-processing peptidase n=1 Tax=Lentisalinibacter sediminis TaxID=2992237 RepID=UPI00386D6179